MANGIPRNFEEMPSVVPVKTPLSNVTVGVAAFTDDANNARLRRSGETIAGFQTRLKVRIVQILCSMCREKSHALI